MVCGFSLSAGFHPAKSGWVAYSASKHALRAVADGLRDEVNKKGVRVMTVFPGRTATPMQEEVHRYEGRDYDPERFLQPGVQGVAGPVAQQAARLGDVGL